MEPDTGTLFSGRSPHLPELVVMVDAELLHEPAPSPLMDPGTFNPEGLLSGLLLHPFVGLYRYADDGPPPSVHPDPAPEGRPVYGGWVVLDPPIPDEPDRVATFRNTPTSYSYSSVIGNAWEVAAGDRATDAYLALDVALASERRRADVLAAQVAEQGVHADLYVTRREYLAKATWGVARETTICTPEEALTLTSLYLRQQGEYIAAQPEAGSTLALNRGLFFWVATRELLPAAWRWFAACVQHSSDTGNDRMTYLGQSLLQRVSRALEARDIVHVVSNQAQDNDLKDQALANLDEVLVLLMGAVDVAARVAHAASGLPGNRVRQAGWQNQGWLEQVRVVVPELADLVSPGSEFTDVLTVLRLLRNSVHGVALQGMSVVRDSQPMQNLVGLPRDDQNELLDAVDRLGGRERWSVTTHAGPVGSTFEPAALVDILFEHVFELLNALMRETPVEQMTGVDLTPEQVGPPSSTQASTGAWDPFDEWTRLSVRWQLGF
jgi:hypothetical protein